MLLKVIEMEDIEKILFMRSSCFIFKVLMNPTPSNFAGTLISKDIIMREHLGNYHYLMPVEADLAKLAFLIVLVDLRMSGHLTGTRLN